MVSWIGNRMKMRFKNINLIPVIVLIGVAILFFFPNPESNFLAYLGTGLLLLIVVIFLIYRSRKKD